MKANCTWLWPQKKVSEILSQIVYVSSVFIFQRGSLSPVSFPKPYFTRIWFDASHSPVFSKADEWTVVERGGKTPGERARRENERETWVNNHNKKRYQCAASTTAKYKARDVAAFNCPAALVSGQRENKHSRISLAYLGASVDAWMTCQLVYTLHVTVHSIRRSLYITHLLLLYCTERVFLNQKLSSTYWPFCMTKQYFSLTCVYSWTHLD